MKKQQTFKQTKFPALPMKQNASTSASAPTLAPTVSPTPDKQLGSITVTALNNEIKDLFNASYKTRDFDVIGEVSNYKTYNNSIYFTLKDDTSSISCCIWSNQKNNFKNGDQVTVKGKLTVYVKTGQYQLTVKEVNNSGATGNLYETFERLKAHYKTIGYFDRPKRQLHPYVDNICVITASGGAALQDFLSVLKKNNYTGNITIKNAVVQGNDCPRSVSNSLDLVNQLDFDVIVVTRGGGSYEDLNGFNSAEIIEALSKINTITISAIGHEVDTVLTDYIADIRAATPTMAAEMITANLIKPGYYYTMLEYFRQQIMQQLNEYKSIVLTAKLDVPSNNAMFASYGLQISKIKDNTSLLIERKIYYEKNRISELRNAFSAVDIKNVLNNYPIIVDKDGNRIINKKTYKKNIKNKIKMKIIFTDGNVILN